MTSKIKKGICLVPSKEEKRQNPLFAGVVVLAVYTALVLMIWQVSGGANLSVMLPAGVLLIITCSVFEGASKEKWFYTGTLILLLLLMILAREKILEGMRLFWNRLGDTYTAGTGTVLTKLGTRYPAEQQGLCSVLFGVAASCVLVLLSCLAVRYMSWLTAALIPLMLLAGCALFRSEAALLCILVTLAASALTLIASGWGKRKPVLPSFLSSVVSAVLIAAFVAVMLVPSVQNWGTELSSEAYEKYHENKYETGYTTLPEGDFTAYTEPDETVPALVVTMESPEETYLRGFVGCTFENNAWTPIDNEILAENSELLYWLNLEKFNPAAQLASAMIRQDFEDGLITVQNIGACSSYIYAPYSLQTEGFGEYLQPEDLSADAILADNERTYVYSVISGGSEMISEVLEYLQAADDDEVLEYRQAESAYRNFVYDHYLEVSPEMTEALEKMFSELGIEYGDAELTKEQAQEYALKFLSLCFSEEVTSEAIELPLQSADGTSFQYATVGTLALRYFGIPARYAEGYVISEQLAVKAEPNESITVDSTCAAGWIEVYQDGIGWIPMALTPGLGEMTEEQSESTQKDSSVPEVQEGKELEEEPLQEEPDPQPDGGSLVTLGKAVQWTLIIILLLILLLIALLYLRRKLTLSRRNKQYTSENKSDAVAWIFADTAKLLEQLGFDRGNSSMTTLCMDVSERLGEEYAQKLEEMIVLNGRALFSSHDLEETQRETALEFRDNTLSVLKTREKWHKRLWMKWIRCLY